MTPVSPAHHGLAFDCADLEAERRQHGPIEARAIAGECGDDLQAIARRLLHQLQEHGDLITLAEAQTFRAVADAAAALAPLLTVTVGGVPA